MMAEMRNQRYQMVTNSDGSHRLQRIIQETQTNVLTPPLSPPHIVRRAPTTSPIIRAIQQRELLSSISMDMDTLILNEEEEPLQIQRYEYFFTSNIKQTQPKHTDCMIMQEPIKTGDLFHECQTCFNVVSCDAMREWWDTCRKDGKEPKCPGCRSEWTDNTLYYR